MPLEAGGALAASFYSRKNFYKYDYSNSFCILILKLTILMAIIFLLTRCSLPYQSTSGKIML
ncbi:MAG: hypothetical protein NHB14_05945 [Desulfosporosinus sp.]|nr:hypothetical protein [Desulfosporosinus sp.]